MNIFDKISWLGRKKREELILLFNSHDVILSTSKIETFGLTVAEGLSRGKPVVVTNAGGFDDFVTTKNGIFSDHTVESYVKAIVAMIENYSRYNSSKIQNDMEAEFSPNAVYGKLHSIYKKYTF